MKYGERGLYPDPVPPGGRCDRDFLFLEKEGKTQLAKLVKSRHFSPEVAIVTNHI